MFSRAFLVWFGFLVMAFVNGAIRDVALLPRLGDGPAHAISSVTLSAAVLILSWFTITWIRPASTSNAWKIGALWFTLTPAFEFLAGHYIFGDPWSRLRANYMCSKAVCGSSS